MANVAAMHNSLANWDDTTTIDFHRFQAVKSVNERLNMEGKDMDTPVSDGVIVAVALLVNTEVSRPPPPPFIYGRARNLSNECVKKI